MPVVDASSHGMWRDRAWLVMGRSIVPPPRCLLCNRLTTDQPSIHRVSASDSTLPIVPHGMRFIMRAVTRSDDLVLVVVCSDCRRRRQQAFRREAIRLGICAAIFAAGAAMQSTPILLIGGAMLCIALLYRKKIPGLSSVKIADGYIWLAGVHESYLEALPVAREPVFDSAVRDPGGRIEALIEGE